MMMNEAISSSNTAAPYSEYRANSASDPQRDGGRRHTPSTGSTQPPIPGGTVGGAVLRVLVDAARYAQQTQQASRLHHHQRQFITPNVQLCVKHDVCDSLYRPQVLY